MSEKTKGGKAKKICIGLIIVAVIAAVVVLVLKLTGVLDINLSKKSKMVAGVEKLGESITDPIDKISDTAEKNGTTIKVLDNISSDSAIEVSAEVSADIEELSIPDLSSSEKSTLKNAIEVANATKLGVDVRYDGDKAAYAKIDGSIDSSKLSGEIVYDGKQAGVRSEELNSKWLTISEDDLNDLMEESGVDIDEVKEIVTSSMEKTDELRKNLEIDEKKQEEIEERYSNILKDFVNEKSKEMESESATITVDGKDKKCTKVTLNLDDDDVKDLLKEYLDTFAKDKDMKKILTETASTYSEMMKEAGVENVVDLSAYIDDFDDIIGDVKSQIDEMEFDGKATLVVYASTTQVYRTDLIIEVEESEVKLAVTYNKNTTVLEASVKINGQSMKLGTVTLTSKDDEIGIRVEAAKDITDLMGGEYYAEIKYKVSKSKSEISMEAKAGEYGEFKVSAVTNIDKNTDKEYADTTVFSIDIDSPEYVTVKLSLTVKTSVKVGDVSIPSISAKDSVDMTDEDAVEEYIAEMNKNSEKLMKDLQSVKALEPFIEDIVDELM